MSNKQKIKEKFNKYYAEANFNRNKNSKYKQQQYTFYTLQKICKYIHTRTTNNKKNVPDWLRILCMCLCVLL